MGSIEVAAARNEIHATAMIDASVVIGTGNVIGPYTVISGSVLIGNGNWIGPHVTIGMPAQHSTRKFELTGAGHSGIDIGSRNVIREYCTVHHPVDQRTIIEDECYLMAYCHISHDTRIQRRAVLANSAQLGGFSDIGEGANIGLSVVTHQFTTVGAFAMIGMGTVLAKDVPPFCKVVGNPARFIGVNQVGMERAGFSAAQILGLQRWFEKGRGGPEASLLRYVVAFRARNAKYGREALGTR